MRSPPPRDGRETKLASIIKLLSVKTETTKDFRVEYYARMIMQNLMLYQSVEDLPLDLANRVAMLLG